MYVEESELPELDQIELVKALYFNYTISQGVPAMAHFLAPDDTISSILLETEQLDDMNDHWTPNGFGIMHIFTEQTRIKKRLRDMDFELPYIQKHFEDMDMDCVVTVLIGVDKKHRKNVLRLNPEVGKNGRVGQVLFKNEFNLQ